MIINLRGVSQNKPLHVSIKELKNNLDILEVAEKYCELKRVSNNDFMAVINPLRDEKTSSLHFYVNTQKFYDYGSSEGGDLFDFIAKVENISLSDVMQKFLTDNHFTPSTAPTRKEPHQAQAIEISSAQMQKEFDNFECIDINNAQHCEELFNVIPEYLLKEANQSDLALFMSCTRYDKQNRTLAAGWYRNSILDFEMITYKRRRLSGGKWINRKNTHPNQTAFNRIYADKKPVYIVEGARDALTAILLGLNFIAIPTTSFKNHSLLLEILNNKDEVIFICEDMQGYKAMSDLSQNIPNSHLVTFVRNKDEKIDLSDFIMAQKSIKGVYNAICA